jgi:hypothetical protein
MIQRIQTLFLFIVFLACVMLFIFPIAGVYSEYYTYKFFIYEFRNMVPGQAPVFHKLAAVPLLVLNVVVGVLSVIAIVRYKNRLLQLKLVRISIFTEILMIALIFFLYANMIEKALQTVPDYMAEGGIYFPLIALIFLILSNRFIIKDERLVRSSERLR